MERIWSPYLTAQDRQHSQLQPPISRGLGDRPALLMVDLYRAVFGREPAPLLEAVETWPSSCGETGWNALPFLQSLLSAARAAEIPVIHVTGLPELPSWREERLTAGRGADIRQRADQYEIVPEVGPAEGEVVLRKAAPSAFWGTPLAGYLQQLRVDSVIVAGESTSGCVRATVVDGCAYRLRVSVPEECVFDRTEAAHAMNLFDMAHKYADVLPLAELLPAIEARGSAARA